MHRFPHPPKIARLVLPATSEYLMGGKKGETMTHEQQLCAFAIGS